MHLDCATSPTRREEREMSDEERMTMEEWMNWTPPMESDAVGRAEIREMVEGSKLHDLARIGAAVLERVDDAGCLFVAPNHVCITCGYEPGEHIGPAHGGGHDPDCPIREAISDE